MQKQPKHFLWASRPWRLSDKGIHSRAGRPLTYPKDVNDALVACILQLLDLHVSVSVLSFQEKFSSASKGWVKKFFYRHRLLIGSRTSVRQNLPQQLEGYLTKFYEDAGRYMRIGEYPHSLIWNMDETPAFFDMIPLKVFVKTGSKECVIWSNGCEKKHVTVVLPATADGKVLPPMIIFKGSSEKTTQKLRVPAGFVIKTQEKVLMDERLMHIWVEDIWLNTLKQCQRNLPLRILCWRLMLFQRTRQMKYRESS